MHFSRRQFVSAATAAGLMPLLAACGSFKSASTKPKVALVLGSGAARGFAHIGVIKVLEANGITPDLIVGTSAGAVVGALYASGINGFELQRIALALDETTFSDWTIAGRGLIKGEALANYVNSQLKNQTIEKLARPLAVVATDLRSGEAIVFQRGDTGTAVRASSAVPGVFSPVRINDREYVDGGLTHPVAAVIARRLGADVVIAVDISSKPKSAEVSSTVDALLQTFTIMGNRISSYELAAADFVITPSLASVKGTDFSARNVAILEGERAAQAVVVEIKSRVNTTR